MGAGPFGSAGFWVGRAAASGAKLEPFSCGNEFEKTGRCDLSCQVCEVEYVGNFLPPHNPLLPTRAQGDIDADYSGCRRF
jgi:hypothetical protein